MAHQSPMISVPRKATDDVDWTTPIRNVIAQSYGENPDSYAAECQSLQRCRQDAVKGAGSDFTARDLLYKYFGQLELLELRFPEIRVNFPWRDAFTDKIIMQTSIAYEKASVLFQIASTHSAIAASQSRSDPEGVKRAFYYFRTSAGMLSYINENFLHAPSTDLSREVIKFLVDIILAQATEVFFEKCADEKKGNALVSKVAAQTASMYTTLVEDVKDFMGKGIFDRNWVTIIQIKSKHFQSLAQYHRGLVDDVAGKHGDALVRFTLAETLAKDASKTAQSFSSVFVSTISPNLPSDSGTSIYERTKSHLAICTDNKSKAQRENDLIYNAILPSYEALPPIDKLAVATVIHIHDVYAMPEVQKTIGQDIFIKLVPLSVHESASVYSEEKAKLVRAEVENADAAEGKARSIVDGMGIRKGLMQFKAMAEDEVGEEEEIPLDVRRWKEDISLAEEREGVQGLLAELAKAKENVKGELDGIERDLDVDSRDCEKMRVEYGHLWTQDPSAALTRNIRQDLRNRQSSLEAAAKSDQQILYLWNSVQVDIELLLSSEVKSVFRERGGSRVDSLLDLDISSEQEDARERRKIKGLIDEVEEGITKLHKINKERDQVLKDLKEKIQADDVSHLLLLNRRNSGVESTLFVSELHKFRPYQQRLASTVNAQENVLQEILTLWNTLKGQFGRGPGARKWEEREKRKKDIVRRFSRARDGYMEARDAIAKGLQFYSELSGMTKELSTTVRGYTNSRTAEREALAGKLETDKRLSASVPSSPPVKPPPPPAVTSGNTDLNSALAGLSLREPWQTPLSRLSVHQESYHQYTSSPSPSQPISSLPSQQYPPVPSQFSLPPPTPLQRYPSYQTQHQHPPSQGYNVSPPPSQQQQQQQYSIPPPPSTSYAGNTYSSPQHSSATSLPPLPSRLRQSSLDSASTVGSDNGDQHNDPYASLAFLGSQGFHVPTQTPGQIGNSLPPLHPSSGFQQQQQHQRQSSHGYNLYSQQPGPRAPPLSLLQQQQPNGFSGVPSAPLFPPPPPPPPPPSQQSQQSQQQSSRQQGYRGYSQGYGGYGCGH